MCTLCPALLSIEFKPQITNSITNKVKLLSFNSCSNYNINCSSNLYCNTDRALPLQIFDTKHVNNRYKVPHRSAIEDSATVNTRTTTTVITCSCSSILPKQVSFSGTMQPLSARVHVITASPRIWRPNPKDRLIPSPVHQDVNDNHFLSPANGLAIRRTIEQPPPLTTKTDIIHW